MALIHLDGHSRPHAPACAQFGCQSDYNQEESVWVSLAIEWRPSSRGASKALSPDTAASMPYTRSVGRWLSFVWTATRDIVLVYVLDSGANRAVTKRAQCRTASDGQEISRTAATR